MSRPLPRAGRHSVRPFPLTPAVRSCGSVLELARRTGVHARQLHRLRVHGLTAVQADELAVRLGHHPVELWGERWWL